jgi:hypothetical protein
MRASPVSPYEGWDLFMQHYMLHRVSPTSERNLHAIRSGTTLVALPLLPDSCPHNWCCGIIVWIKQNVNYTCTTLSILHYISHNGSLLYTMPHQNFVSYLSTLNSDRKKRAPWKSTLSPSVPVLCSMAILCSCILTIWGTVHVQGGSSSNIFWNVL